MVVKLEDEELNRKLKRERIEVCFGCKRFLNCENIGKFEECADFEESETEAFVIRQTRD